MTHARRQWRLTCFYIYTHNVSDFFFFRRKQKLWFFFYFVRCKNENCNSIEEIKLSKLDE